MHVDSTT